MKTDCNVIRDLLPLYYDGYTRDGSTLLVQNHLKECTKCRKLYEELLASDVVEQVIFDEEKESEKQEVLRKKAKKIRCGITAFLSAVTVGLLIPILYYIVIFVYSILQG